MKLSVIIVNYNVRYFLEQAVVAALNALKDVDGELIVVDNHSSDGSKEMMEQSFTEVRYIYLKENVGFSKANNIGIDVSKAEYVLLLNPDTVVAENAFKLSLEFMDNNPSAGGLGVHMIDGSGRFLPESKRGLPTPKAAFYKIFGLSNLFKSVKKFGQYHLGYLDKEKTHQVDILSGAYMMMRKSALDKAGLLDETFFMYGEDIDLSYRLIKAGYQNYYFPEARIIHYKGESTKKGSVNYVFVFYRAMLIFAKKHFEKGQASMFGFLINSAIYFRAFLAILRRLFGKLWQTFLDIIITYSAFLASANWYADVANKNFDLPFVSLQLICYAVIIPLVLLYAQVYDAGFRLIRLFKGWLIAVLFLLGIYALLPENYHFSRAVLLIGSGIALLGGISWRVFLSAISNQLFSFAKSQSTRILIVGNEGSLNEIRSLMDAHAIPHSFVAGISPLELPSYPVGFIGSTAKLNQAIRDFNIDELIFDTRAISNLEMIGLMEQCAKLDITFKMALGSPLFIIGSQEVIAETPAIKIGDIKSLNLSAIRRLKRSSDLMLSCIMLLTLPISIWMVDDRAQYLKNLVTVFFGRSSWTGYDSRGAHPLLPKLKPSIIHPNIDILLPNQAESQVIEDNIQYLKKFNIWMEWSLTLRHLHALGNRPA